MATLDTVIFMAIKQAGPADIYISAAAIISFIEYIPTLSRLYGLFEINL